VLKDSFDCLLFDGEEMNLKFEFSKMPFEILFDKPLAPYTTLQIGGKADFLAFPENEKDLFDLLEISNIFNLPITVLGGGANTLILDGGVRGLVISLSKNFKGIEILLENKTKFSLQLEHMRKFHL